MSFSRIAGVFALLVLLGWSGWVRAAEPRVVSSITTVELEPDGSARVRHLLHVESLNGSWDTLVLSGIAPDARLSPDAQALRDDLGGQAAQPMPLDLILQRGRATLAPPEPLYGKSFAVEFGYSLQLSEHGGLSVLPDGQHAELIWVGPRFEEPPDSATLIVRAIAATHPPKAVDAHSERLLGGPGSAIVLSALRRSAERDELEVVLRVEREQVPRWRILLDRSVLQQDALDAAGEQGADGVDLDGIWPAPERSAPRAPLALVLPWVLLAGAAYGLLVASKARAVRGAAALRGAQVLPLLKASDHGRAAASGLLLSAASVAALWLEAPLLAAVVLLVVLALGCHRPALCEPRLRGPGQWQPLEANALAPVPGPALPGAWLDVGRAPGAVLLVALLTTLSALSLRLFERSPYYGACLLLGGVALLPVFCTGRAAELPPQPLAESRRFLRRVLRRLGRRPELVVQVLGRSCTGLSELDELRLAIHPARALEGLIGMELALELQPSIAGQIASPVLIVRAAEGSLCQRSLPRQLSWTRGRSAEERAALVRPKLPSVALSVELIRELSAAASEPEPSQKGERRRSSTRRPTRAAPAHAS